jgi:hypothetical protein
MWNATGETIVTVSPIRELDVDPDDDASECRLARHAWRDQSECLTLPLFTSFTVSLTEETTLSVTWDWPMLS